MKAFICDLITTEENHIVIDYTNGAHQFLLKHNITYRTHYDSLLIFQPKDGFEIEAQTLEDLVQICKEYNATVSISFSESNGVRYELEFIG